MTHNPLISVIMPAYNHERYVGEAIGSVLTQTLADLELIIINDGSTDKTENVVKKFDDSRIKYFKQENRGAHDALNAGISHATGKYISIINSDDVYDQKRLAVLCDTLDDSSARLAFTDLKITDETLRPLSQAHPTVAWHERVKSVYHDSHSLVYSMLKGNWVVTTSNLFMQTEFARQIGPFANFRYAHDYDFVLRTLNNFKPTSMVYIDQKLLFYRLHKSNTFKENFVKLEKETLSVLRKHIPDFMTCENDRVTIDHYLSHVDDMLSEEHNLLESFMRARSWRVTSPLRKIQEYYFRFMK
jgi:glycosyltransferase involved in cell wall biosynthesis